MKLTYLLLSTLFAGAASLTECSNTSATCDGGCADAADTAPPVSGGGCDSSKPLSQGGCAVADSDGFFVSPTGSDSGNGAKATPFLTIGKGVTTAAAAPLKPNVYVCAGTYPENVVVQNAPAGVALHGGFDCTSWAQTSAATTISPPYVTSTSPAYPLHVLGVAVLVEDLILVAPGATDPGVSSIGAYVDGSPGMTFRRATVTSGAGADATNQTALAVLAPNTSGNIGNTAMGGATQDCKCTSDDTIGGQGGYAAGPDGGSPANGAPIVNGNMDAGLAAGQNPCFGGTGADGLVAQNGNSTGTLGELTSNGWLASPGGAGALGGTAQGGGGGYWNLGNGAGGGGGACGGCGGSGGLAGAGGGASIAVAALSSTLRIQGATIIAGKAGNGGNGASGQPGQPGGTGGEGWNDSCNGGNGGTGGAGGAGGGGAGGISVAIATYNTTPVIDSQSTVLAGNAGQGGVDGTALQVRAVAGVANPVYSF